MSFAPGSFGWLRAARLGALVAAALAVASCASVRVTSDYDPATDFSSLTTYAWLERPPPREPVDLNENRFVTERVVRAVDARLAAKGYERVSPTRASFLLTYHRVTDRRLRVDSLDHPYGVRGGYSDTRVREVEVGTLVIDVVSNEEDRVLLWRGTGSTPVRNRGTPEQREAEISRVVAAILERFPPGARAR